MYDVFISRNSLGRRGVRLRLQELIEEVIRLFRCLGIVAEHVVDDLIRVLAFELLANVLDGAERLVGVVEHAAKLRHDFRPLPRSANA